MSTRPTNLAVYAVLVVFGLFALAGVLLVTPGPESTQRLGLLFGVIATGVAALVAVIRSDQSATNTNGKLDARIELGVHRALESRLRGERPKTTDDIDEQHKDD